MNEALAGAGVACATIGPAGRYRGILSDEQETAVPEITEPETGKAGGAAPAAQVPERIPSSEPVYSAEEIKPPAPEANSYGGGIDAADLPPTIPDDAAGPGSAHEAEGWRAIETKP